MVLENFINNFSVILADAIEEEEIMILGVNNEIQTLLQKIKRFQSLLADAEKRKFTEPCIEKWLFELKDVMYDAEDVIDLCKIEGAKLLENQNHNSKTTTVCCNFLSAFTCFANDKLLREGVEQRKQNKEAGGALSRERGGCSEGGDARRQVRALDWIGPCCGVAGVLLRGRDEGQLNVGSSSFSRRRTGMDFDRSFANGPF
ncbi:Putative disease resistance RPP13-like protein 1 [Dendrobium catenatum]|uniref:Disease resistance RPP13-like protein 1 n=1 Tax=Dendrobium catenatum TaxID=906689 RepID=A0A2I0X6W9_9ASPA|nr:Putative disease resistance RPP13-like protein 1 [Dendrobium catenatum]